ncbi:MAG: helix-turn-helix domain-containing protein [Defluviitaleaceae bacterium]|nr:helix-turn-helix domain-containing protein [Defluviitaleaceae bacterium]
MYYPLQIPYLLDNTFSQHILYTEKTEKSLKDFVICLWEPSPRSSEEKFITNVIATDGCIDLIVNFGNQTIGFAGMSKTDSHFTVRTPNNFFGARMKPGAFYQLTGLPATAAMDNYVSLDEFDPSFDVAAFFNLSLGDSKAYIKDYLELLVRDKKPDDFTNIFDSLSISPPPSAAELYKDLHLSARQCQRAFIKHFGFTPQTALSIIRFQRCLKLLTSSAGETKSTDALEIVDFYDQSHFIKDFKKNIGLTPKEYLQICKK